MSEIRRLLRPIGHAVVAFFRHDLALKRSRSGFQVVLREPKAAAGPAGSPADLTADRQRQELLQILTERNTLLDEQPGSRQTLRHLVFVQNALAKKGLRALDKLPLDVMQRALDQFEGLVTNWAPVGLATLRSKMAVAILERAHEAPAAEAGAGGAAEPAADGAGPPPLPDVVASDEAALAAAYAALGAAAPTAASPPKPDTRSMPLDYRPEPVVPAAPAARPPARPASRAAAPAAPADLRVLQD